MPRLYRAPYTSSVQIKKVLISLNCSSQTNGLFGIFHQLKLLHLLNAEFDRVDSFDQTLSNNNVQCKEIFSHLEFV